VKKLNVILFGSVPLATWVALKIMEHNKMNLEGVVCETDRRQFKHHGLNLECVFDFARRHSIPIMNLQNLQTHLNSRESYIGISVRYSRIIPNNVINMFDRGIVNFHGGDLPRYRGVNIANHCILEGAKCGGATLHYIDEGIDTGNIIDKELFPIESNDTAYDVFLKTQSAIMALADRNIGKMPEDTLPSISQEAMIEAGEIAHTYKKSDIEQFRKLDLSLPPEEIDRRVRAFAFPTHEPAYFEFENRKFYVIPEPKPSGAVKIYAKAA